MLEYYYYLQAIIFMAKYSDKEILKAEQLLLNAITIKPDYLDVQIALAKFYLQKKDISCCLKNDRQNAANLERIVAREKSQSFNKAVSYFNLARKTFRDNELLYKKNKFILSDMADLYLKFEDINEADKLYKTASGIDGDFVSAVLGAGIVASKNNNYKDAITAFKKAMILDTQDYFIKTNLADAYTKNGDTDEAEKCYTDVINIDPYNMDALTGLGELYKNLGDLALEKDNKSDADDYYESAKKKLMEVLLMQKSNLSSATPPSRKLAHNEISAINYSLGYIESKLYETKKNDLFSDKRPLNKAKEYFLSVKPGTDTYNKAQSSINKIIKALNQYSFFNSKAGSVAIIIASLLILSLIQVAFFYGKPREVYGVTIPQKELFSLLHTEGLDSLKQQFINLSGRSFSSVEKMLEAFKAKTDKLKIEKAIDPQGIMLISDKKFIRWDPIGEVTYVSMTLGLLVFTIAGFFMRQLSKLKVGGVELEKTSSDQLSISQSVGVRK